MKTSHFLGLAFTSFCLIFSPATFGQDATALYNEGVQLKKGGKSKDAAEKFKLAIAQKPGYTEAIYELGWCQNDIKDYRSAINSLRSAREKWFDVPKVYFELGYAFEKTSQRDSAINCYNECLRLKPDYSLVYKQLGTLAYNNDNYKEALNHFAQYELHAKSEITDYLYWYRKGFMLNAQSDYTLAVNALRKSLASKADYINTYLELGFSSNKLKMADDAIAYYKKAMEIDPKSHIPYNGIGEVYRDTKKDIKEAKTWYQKTLAIKSNERKACFGMGYCLNNEGKYEEAMGYLRTAIEQEPTYTAAYVELGYSQYMQSKYSEAIDNFKKALSLNPKNENARYYSCQVYLLQKNRSMAQKMVDELKELNSKHVVTLQPKVNAL